MKIILGALLATIFALNTYTQELTLSKVLQARISIDSGQSTIVADGIILYNQDYIYSFYKNRNYNPIWTDHQKVKELIGILERSDEEGLIPEDYHLNRLGKLLAYDRQLQHDADLELICTDAAILYARHLLNGKVEQSEIREGWDLPRNSLSDTSRRMLETSLSNMQLEYFFNSIKPHHFMYTLLKEGLKKYRNIASTGGWPAIPNGEVLKPGSRDVRVPLLRNYLYITGDLDLKYGSDTSTNYDTLLVNAVRKFQFRHNLNQDGVIGKGTLLEMNVPIEKRIEQIRINLERARWITHYLPNDFLVVNIAGFNIRRITNDSVVFYSRVIVGKLYHESPIFDGKLIYAELNPTWTIPRSIAIKETLPKLISDPNYLREKNMILMDVSGNQIDPLTIDFSQLTQSNFPYTVRQNPGPHNALGQVKFIFPNKYSVYVHDTPVRSLFSMENRAFSHGCIRIERKWELFLNIMGDDWSQDRIDKVLKSGETTRVNLKNPLPILLLYWTAGADKYGDIFFDKDVYDRDPEVLEKLNLPVLFKTLSN